MPQIRLNKTPEIEEVLAFLRSKYRILSESEIIKLALAEKYKKEIEAISMIDEETEGLIGKGVENFKNERYIEVKTEKELDTYLKNL